MNKNSNNIVNTGDHIFATLEYNGRRIASINGMNFNSLDSVKRALLELAGHYVGIALLTVRNCTRGWRDVTALATMRRTATASQPAMMTDYNVGKQYLIPWAG